MWSGVKHRIHDIIHGFFQLCNSLHGLLWNSVYSTGSERCTRRKRRRWSRAMVGQRGELTDDGAVVEVQSQQVRGEEKRRRNRLTHRREKKWELIGDSGVEWRAHQRKRLSLVMGRPSGFSCNKWEGMRRWIKEKMRGYERMVFWVLMKKWVCSTKYMGANRITPY